MGYEISISENGKYIIIEVVEPITGQLEKRFMKDGLDALKAYGIKKIFINVSKVPNVAGVVEQYQLAYDDAVSQELPRDTRIAIFAALDDHSHDFIETVFKNAGYNCSLFRDKNSAIEWLEKSNPR